MCVDLASSRILTKGQYAQQPHYASDLNFIRTLLQSMDVSLTEEEARQQFHDYTQYITDIALVKGFFQNGSRRVQKMLTEHAGRIEKWEQTQVYAVSVGEGAGRYEDSVAMTMRQLLTRLRIGMLDNSLDDQEAKKLYFEVDTLLCTDKDCIELLAVVPNQGDLRCFTWGLFRASRGLQDCAMSILLKLEENEIGKEVLRGLSSSELDRFQSLKQAKTR